ncbi:pyridoxal-dependent decarboxylase [Eubacterium sp. MSJ-33]|uniref:pyridoxal-dependent decarboxylase n=1 Tax=Eubacterium sp. MSJ-33 TaxID=2841528 RepID=UPI001C743AE6|nr:pyridoxal-dependent decarboxylase [Eubacterium sp. MSJ-33]QWT54155.1 pyridoxal-dependent decarboxylase [Eubacterium sp. MSJ-33]
MRITSEKINELREVYGDSFYLLDSEQFTHNFWELKAEFAKIYPNFNIAYSYKTNYIPKLCRIVNELGGYAEVVSEMELELAYRCGVKPQNIIWNGPIKNPDKLENFLLSGGTVNIDSIDEAEYIESLAQKTECVLNVGIRCNFDVQDGVLSRFGLDVFGEDFQSVLEMVTHNPKIHLINYQCHFAKRQIEFWPARAKGMIDLIEKTGIVPERVDIGGGLYGKMADSLREQFSDEIPNYSAYATVAACVFADYFKDRSSMPELVIEPGSALVGDCMKFVGTVKTIKNIRGKYIASVLGSQKNISMTGVNPPIEVLHMSEGKDYRELDMVGFTCIEGDVLYKNYNGHLAKGDAIVISNCGSYSLVMKPPFILPNFPVLDICGAQTEVIKRAETFEDIFNTFNI